jgi:hypothetical protein
VKGHQDDHHKYDSLPVTAQYNIRADELADIYMELCNPSHLLSPLLPAARCNFAIGGITQQGHYTKVIRHQVALPSLYEYLRGRHHWRKGIEHSIAWESFQEAANNYHQTDNHLMKLVYDKLPAGKQKSVAAKYVPAACRHCEAPETFDHIMRYSHIVSIKFCRDHFAAVLHFCKKNHAPKAFTTLFLQAIKDFLNVKSPLQSTPQTSAINALIHSQQQIGWHLFMHGFLSTLWERYLQAQILRQLPTDKRLSMEPAAFITGLIKTLWTSMSTLWTNHCNQVHRPS